MSDRGRIERLLQSEGTLVGTCYHICAGWKKYVYEVGFIWDKEKVLWLCQALDAQLRWKDFSPWGGGHLFEILTPHNSILRGTLGGRNLYAAFERQKESKSASTS